jgi:hypothetical protein
MDVHENEQVGHGNGSFVLKRNAKQTYFLLIAFKALLILGKKSVLSSKL